MIFSKKKQGCYNNHVEEIYKARKKATKSNKNEFRRRILKYALMSIGAMALLAIALFYVLAYRFDVKNAEVKQTGLVKFTNSLSNAQVYVDGELKNLRTTSEQVLDIGEHNVRYEMKDYQSWQKTFTLSHGQVLWLDYVLMLPNNLQSNVITEVGENVKNVLVTRDKKFALVQYADLAQFALVTISDPTKINVQKFALSDEILSPSESTNQIEIIESDNWSKRFLIQHKFVADGNLKDEYIVINRDNLGLSKNLTSDLVVDAHKVSFSEEKEDQLYIIDKNDDLRLVDCSTRLISAPVVRGVIAFSQYDDKMAVASNNGKGEMTVGILRSGKNYKAVKNFLLADGDFGNIDVNFNNYFKKDYVVIMARNQINIINDPFSESRKTSSLFTENKGASATNELKWIEVNSNGQVILAGDNEFAHYYNMETKEEINQAFRYNANLNRPQFIDKFKVSVGDKLVDVDGSNVYELEEFTENIFLSSDRKYLFNLSNGEGGNKTLTQTKIVL